MGQLEGWSVILQNWQRVMAACVAGLAVSLAAAADTIPERQTFIPAWHSAGLTEKTFPNPRLIVNVRDFGALGNGVSNDYAAFNAAITSLNFKAGVVFVPAGSYYLRSPLTMRSGVILRGQSATNTTLTFSTNFFSQCINISGGAFGAYQFIQGGATQYSSQVTVTNVGVLTPGRYVGIRMYKPGSWGLSEWGTNNIGQIAKILAITGAVVTLDQPLRQNYSLYEPQIAPLNSPMTNAGIENLRITRDYSAATSTADERDNMFTIRIAQAADCWVRGANLFKCFGAHIGLEYATHNEFRGNYLEEAHEYDGGGSGYGIRFEMFSCENLAENNIFRKLRHSMLYQIGANANVLGYNYSREGRDSFGFQTSDITTHGNYPFANLAEGNICSFISLDNSHGWNGPYNTYYRNIATHSYGISDESSCRNEAFVGNETANAFDPATSRAFVYGNTKSTGIISPHSQTWSNLYDYSYYLTEEPMLPPPKPSWWVIPQSHLWPIGPTNNANNYSTTKYIPAKSRYDAGGLKTFAPPSIERMPPETVLALPGSTVVLSALAHGSPSVAYAWFKDGALLPGETGTNLTLAGIDSADMGSYAVSFTDAGGSLTSPPTALFLFDGAMTFTNNQGFLDVPGNWDPPVGPPGAGQTGIVASSGLPMEAVVRTNLPAAPAELIIGTGGVLTLAASLTTEHRLMLDGGSVRSSGSNAIARSAALKGESRVGSEDGLLSLRWKLSDHAAGAGKLVVSNSGSGATAVYSIGSPYSGGTELQAGDLLVYSNYATGAGPVEVLPDGVFKPAQATLLQSNDVVLSGGRLVPHVASAFKAPIRLRADSMAGSTNALNLSIYGPILDHAAGAGRLIVSNTDAGAVLIYSIGSTYSGGTEVRLGSLLVYSNEATGRGPVEVMPDGIFKPALATLIQTNPVVLAGGALIPHLTSAFKAPIQMKADSLVGATNAYILSVYGPIADHAEGAGRLIVSNTGPGYVAFYSINSTYSGGTEVRLGSLLVYSNYATGVGPIEVFPDGIFKPALATLIQTNPVVLSGGWMSPQVSSAFKAPIQVRADSPVGSPSANYLALYGPISDHAEGAGRVIISNTAAGDVRFYCINSTFSGGTEVRLGNLLVYSNAAYGSGPVEVMPNGTLQAGASTVQSTPVVLKGGRFYTAGNYTYAGPIRLWSDSFLDATGTTAAVLSGPIGDFDETHRGMLIKKGTGYVALAGGTNQFTGGLEVREGTLACTINGSLGAGDTEVLADAILYLNTHSNASHGAGVITVRSNGILQLNASYSTNAVIKPGGLVRGVAGGNRTTYDRIQLEGDGLIQRQSVSGYVYFRGPFCDGAVPGRFVLATTNPLPLYLAATNLYTGGTLLTDGGTGKVGELILLAGGSLPDVGTVTLESNSVFNLAGISDTIGSLAGFGEVKFGAVAAARLTVADDRETVFAGVFSGTGGLIRAGAGALALAGSTGWAGPAVVTGGLLRVDGVLGGGGVVTVHSNGFIGGRGVITRALEIRAGGGFDWRDRPATVTVVTNGVFPLAADSVFRYRFDAGTGSCLAVQGTLQLPASAVVEPLPLAGHDGFGSFEAVLMRADALSGSAGLAGWTVKGRNYRVYRTATEVVLRYRPDGVLILVR
jgi:autotransporter-associated beta strand protein